MSVTINASTTSGLVQSADTSGTIELQSNGTTKLTIATTGAYGQLVRGTANSTTGTTSIDFTSIPSWVKRITVMLSGISTNGTTDILVQIGAGSVTSSGYVSGSARVAAANSTGRSTSTAGYNISTNSASTTLQGILTIANITSNTWVSSHSINNDGGSVGIFGGGTLALGGTLDRVRITTVNGTDTFDAGTINILYEG